MRIGEMLLAEGRLSREQIEKARQVQQRLGGRLGTSLLELGAVDEEVLLEALGRQRATRTVSGTELARAPAAVVRMIPAKLAKRYGIVPYQLKGRTLFVASRDIGDPLKEDEIGFLTSCLVRSCIALEFRIFEALERHYKISGHPRNVALARRLEARQGGSPATESDQPVAGGNGRPEEGGRGRQPAPARPASARAAAKPTTPKSPTKNRPEPPTPRKPQPRFIELDEEDAALLGRSTDSAWPPAQDEPVLLKPTPLPWLARDSAASDAAASEAAFAPQVADAPEEAEPAPAAPAPLPASRPPSVEPLRVGGTAGESLQNQEAGTASVALSIDEWLRNAGSELKHAEIRDDIADVLLAFCEPFLRRRLLLIARRDRIVGWRGEGEGVGDERVRAIEIPAGEPSVFLGLSGSDSFWLGALPALDANQPLIDALGGTAPRECVVLPVALRSRVVCYLYGDNLDAGVAGVPVAQLRRLAVKAGLAFEVCILKNKMRIV